MTQIIFLADLVFFFWIRSLFSTLSLCRGGLNNDDTSSLMIKLMQMFCVLELISHHIVKSC